MPMAERGTKCQGIVNIRIKLICPWHLKKGAAIWQPPSSSRFVEIVLLALQGAPYTTSGRACDVAKQQGG
ncbi:MAG: hypothetical protein RLZZ519_1819 [Bacteroidota bacterium]|jgi:hypothetical protein